jgi:hypothetical protein
MKLWLAGCIAVLLLESGVRAQPQIGSYIPPVVNPRPAISPYLNLNRTLNPAINYYGIVRPQIENHQAITQLQQQVQTTQTQIQNQTGQTGLMGQDEMLPTGRTGGYFNYSHYFPIYSRNAGNTGGTATPAATGVRR